MALCQMSETILPHDKNRIDLHPVPSLGGVRFITPPASRNDISHVVLRCEIGNREAGTMSASSLLLLLLLLFLCEGWLRNSFLSHALFFPGCEVKISAPASLYPQLATCG